MSFDTAKACFKHSLSLEEFPEPESELLNNVRRALEHYESSDQILGRILQLGKDGVTHEELSWGRNKVVWTQGGRVQHHWTFPSNHEEIRAACWAYFEEQDSQQPQSDVKASSHHSPLGNLLTEETTSVFGPYGRVTKNTKKRSAKLSRTTTTSDEDHIPGSGAMVRAMCIIFRSFARIYSEDGAEYYIHVPFLTRKAWPLHPIGILLEQETIPDTVAWMSSSLEIEPTVHSLSSPLRSIAPVGLAHQIRNASSGNVVVYQDDLSHPNQNINTFSSVKDGEKVIYVGPHVIPSHQIIFTVDTRLQAIHCYAYGYSSSNEPSPSSLFSARENQDPTSYSAASAETLPYSQSQPYSQTQTYTQSQNSDAPTKTSSQWLVEETPVPSGWRDPRPDLGESDVEGIDLLSVINAPLLDFQDEEDEEIVGPDYWLQRLASIPIDHEAAEHWSAIHTTAFNEAEESQLADCFAILLPTMGIYRLIQLSWEQQTPFVPHSSLSAIVDVSTHPAISIVKVKALRDQPYDLLVLRPDYSLSLLSGNQIYGIGLVRDESIGKNSLRIVWTGDEVTEQTRTIAFPVHSLVQRVGSVVGVRLINGEVHDVSFNLIPRNGLIIDILSALHYALPSPDFNSLRRRRLQRWLSQGMPASLHDELDSLWTALFEVIGCDSTSFYQHSPLTKKQIFNETARSSSHRRFADDGVLANFQIPQATIRLPASSPGSSLAAPVLLALHLLAQSLRIDTMRSIDQEHLLRGVLRLSKHIAPTWADYWSRLYPDIPEAWGEFGGRHTSDVLPTTSPDFISYCLQGRAWIDVESISVLFNFDSDSQERPQAWWSTKLDDLSTFFSIIRKNTRIRDLPLAEALCSTMVERNWDLKSLDTLPASLSTPIREVLKICQLGPKMSYSLEMYKLIDREDLFEFSRGVSSGFDTPVAEEDVSLSTVGAIIGSAHRISSGLVETDESVGNLTKDLFTDIRWADDRRLEEVELMLQSSRIPVVKIQYSQPPNEQEKENTALVARISERTLSLPPGRALFTYGCLSNATPEAYAVPKIQLSVRIMPANSVMALESSKISYETRAWADFHNGVAAGLRLSPHSTSVESSWIQFAKPSELSAEHAGFLLGLGLNGHLKHVDTWNTFSYLSPKHDLTSMALLIGLAASNVGSSSHYITRLIAVHTPALLPIRTVDINVSLLTQSAGLAALGLLYLGTGDRRLADVTLQEISRADIMAPTHMNREAYTLSAALAFGMIMVGRGSKTTSSADTLWLNQFRVLIHGDRNASARPNLPKNFDLNITAPGASLALAMLYLKSGRTDVADIVSVPTTRIALNTVPPNLLLLRTLAKSLILWDDIQPTADWVNAQYLPMKAFGMTRAPAADAPSANALDIANYNVIAGACLALALKYAGTASADAWKVVVFYYDSLIRQVYLNARTYEHSIRRQATRDAVNVLSCAMAIIMAGSGDIDCLQRLRYAHGKYNSQNKFGMHMANHMAMGLLFLGGGRYTLGTSDAAICALLVSFYPRFPLFGADNRFHLQALRHVWTLAVEPRCLITRDVDTRKVIFLPVKIKVTESYGRVGSLQLLAPTLTHDFDAIRSLRVDSPRYWPFFVDYDQMPQFRDAFIRNQTLWVKRRRGYLGYYEDPHCTRSSFVRSSGGATGDIVCLDSPELLDDNAESSRDFNEFMTSFTEDDRITTFAERLCSDETGGIGSRHGGDEARQRIERAWSTYCQAALMDCFAADKPAILPSYMTLHSIRSQAPEDSSTFSAGLLDIVALQEWYRAVSMQRPPLIRSQVIKSVFLSSATKLDSLRLNTTFMRHLRDYVNGRAVKESDGQARKVIGRQLAFYLTESETPSASSLALLKDLYVRTVQTGVTKGISPDSLRSALMMVMKETVEQAMGKDWNWHAISDILNCWREG